MPKKTPRDEGLSDDDALRASALRISAWSYFEIANYMGLESQAVAFELARRGLALPKTPAIEQLLREFMRSAKLAPARRMNSLQRPSALARARRPI
jgi:hypothetical protein